MLLTHARAAVFSAALGRASSQKKKILYFTLSYGFEHSPGRKNRT